MDVVGVWAIRPSLPSQLGVFLAMLSKEFNMHFGFLAAGK